MSYSLKRACNAVLYNAIINMTNVTYEYSDAGSQGEILATG